MKRAKYITAIYLPVDKPDDPASCRFASRALRGIHQVVIPAIERLERSQEVVGDALTVFIDDKMKSHPNGKKAYELVKNSKLNVESFPGVLPELGFWCKKWHITLKSLEYFSQPVIWLDFTDAEIIGKFTEEEMAFLDNGRGIVCEWEKFRVFGLPMHLSNGQVHRGRQYQPQTSIYYLASEELPKLAIETNIDHDQMSLGHVMEEKYGIYQDEHKGCYEFSSKGLFDTGTRNCITNKSNTYESKIRHKYIPPKPKED